MTYPEKPSFYELVKLAELTVERRSRSYVDDAVTYARWILQDGVAMLTNLTSVQTRCTELLEENRLLRRQLEAKSSE